MVASGHQDDVDLLIRNAPPPKMVLLRQVPRCCRRVVQQVDVAAGAWPIRPYLEHQVRNATVIIQTKNSATDNNMTIFNAPWINPSDLHAVELARGFAAPTAGHGRLYLSGIERPPLEPAAELSIPRHPLAEPARGCAAGPAESGRIGRQLAGIASAGEPSPHPSEVPGSGVLTAAAGPVTGADAPEMKRFSRASAAAGGLVGRPQGVIPAAADDALLGIAESRCHGGGSPALVARPVKLPDVRPHGRPSHPHSGRRPC